MVLKPYHIVSHISFYITQQDATNKYKRKLTNILKNIKTDSGMSGNTYKE